MRALSHRLACFTAAAWLALAASRACALAPFVAEYAVSTRGIPAGVMTRRLSLPAPGLYRLEMRIEPRGLAALLGAGTITEVSEGALHDGRPRPTRYVYHRAGKRERTTTVSFDWPASQVEVVDKREWRFPSRSGLLDKLAYQLALAQDLADRPAAITYSVADAGGIKDYPLAIVGEERVTLADGEEVAAIRVEYRRADTERRTVLWCAPAYDYQPVRIEYREDDGEVTIAILSDFRPADA